MKAVLETLEGRTLLSSVTLNDGVLTLQGDGRLTADAYPTPATILAVAGDVVKRFAAADVQTVQIRGGDDADRVYVNAALNVDAEIQTFGGRDTILAGGGDDRIDSGDGDDTIDAGAGNDTIIGGAGHDTIKPGGGVDSIVAAPGEDTIYSSAGHDTIVKPSDSSTTPPPVTSPPTQSNGGSKPTVKSTETVVGDNVVKVATAATETSGPAAAFQLIGKSGMASHPVHVNGLFTTLGQGDVLTGRYEWDFGDPAGRFNTLVGWNAAHIYDRPGTYTVKLTVTNEAGKQSQVSTTVTVTADTRRTIYVDSSLGADANDGSSVTKPVRTLRRAAALLSQIKNDVRVLFRRGQRFDADTYLSVTGENVLIGAYGSGAKPIIRRVEGYGDSAVYTFKNSDHVVIENLTFDSKWPSVGNKAPPIDATAIFVYGRNIAVRGNTFLNVDDAVNSNGFPTGLLVQDNDAPLLTGLRGYLVWGQGNDHVYLGNSAANSTRQHIIRTWGMDRVLVAYNNFTNADRSKVESPDYSKGTIEIQAGSYAYVANNTVYNGQMRVGPRGGEWEPVSVEHDWSVFENNVINNVQAIIYPGTHHSTWRNNIIRRDGGLGFSVNSIDGLGRTITDLNILNNTVVNNSVEGEFMLVTEGRVGTGHGDGITLRNNLWLAPNIVPGGGNGVAGLFIRGTSLNSFDTIADNVWPLPDSYHGYAPGGIHYIWPNWSDARGYLDAKEWATQAVVHDDQFLDVRVDSTLAPLRGTAAATAGHAAAGVFVDFYGKRRSLTGAVSAGAVQAS